MTNFRIIIIAACSSLVLMSCLNKTQETDSTVTPDKQQDTAGNAPGEYAKDSEEVEAYVMAVEDSARLNEGNSLYYSKSDGQACEVIFKVDENNEVLKLTEQYTTVGGGSINSNHFYYKDGLLYVSKELFQQGTGDDATFAERVSYYEENGEPIVSKQRVAPFEEALEEERFVLIANYKCSDEKAKRALSQEGEFETNFRGFVDDGHLRYLMVGENKEDGFETAILIQQRTAYINYLYANQKLMMGTKLIVNFETINESSGFSFQSLISVVEGASEKRK